MTAAGASSASVAEHAARLAERAGEVALCLDFDGTLSPIVDDPQAARPLQGIVELLEPLARRFAAVALVSAARPPTWPSTPRRPASATWGCTACRRSSTARSRSTHAWRRPGPRSWRPTRTSRPILLSRPAAPG
jgi:trehalose-6-phosphatase